MNTNAPPPSFERIYAAIRPTDRADVLLDAASRLAEAFGAELCARFVMDSDLLNFAALPFTRRIAVESGEIAPLDPAMMRSALASQAETAERDVAARATKRRLTWSFQTLSDAGPSAVTRLCAEEGLVIADAEGSVQGAVWRSLFVAPAGQETARAAVLFIHSGEGLEGPVYVFADSPVLDFAGLLAERLGSDLVVFTADEAGHARISQWARDHDVAVRIERIGFEDPADRLATLKGGLLVIGRERARDFGDKIRGGTINVAVVGSQ